MKIGSIVYAKYPRTHGEGMGIIVKFQRGYVSVINGAIIPDRVKVFWALTSGTDWYKVWDLEVINENR